MLVDEIVEGGQVVLVYRFERSRRTPVVKLVRVCEGVVAGSPVCGEGRP